MTCYTYLIVCRPTNQWYYGVRHAQDAHPDELWKTYFTSSKHVQRLIEEHGESAFTYEVRKTFDSRDSALQWEKNVLIRMKAVSRSDCINRSTGFGGYQKNSIIQTNLERRGVEWPFQDPEVQKKARATTKNRDKKRFNERVKATSRRKRGVDHHLQSSEIIEKMNATFMEKYGVSHVSKIPAVSEKKKAYLRDSRWMYHPQLGRAKIRAAQVQSYLDQGYVRGIGPRQKRL